MKRLWGLLLMLLVTIALIGCTSEDVKVIEDKNPAQNEEYSSMIGYVMDKDDNGRILVVSPRPQDFSETGGVEEFYNAIWFSSSPENILLGNKVEIWYDIVAESYPGQSEVKDIKVLEEEKPKGANLSEIEALNRVLTSKDIEVLTTVYSIDYDKANDRWTIKLKDIWTDNQEILEFEIEDSDK